jgi:hypothetical protein
MPELNQVAVTECQFVGCKRSVTYPYALCKPHYLAIVLRKHRANTSFHNARALTEAEWVEEHGWPDDEEGDTVPCPDLAAVRSVS